MPSRIDGVSQVVIETWIRRDFGLTSAQLRAALELRDGVCPEPRIVARGAVSARDVYLARVIQTLPAMAKRRCAARVEKLAGTYASYLFPKPPMMSRA